MIVVELRCTVRVRSSIRPAAWNYSADDRTFQLLWVRVDTAIVGALYHPPRPLYDTKALLDYIEACVVDLSHQFPAASMADDFNQLADGGVMEAGGTPPDRTPANSRYEPARPCLCFASDILLGPCAHLGCS